MLYEKECLHESSEVVRVHQYLITKVLNNNVIICTDEGKEVILIGKGIGFNMKKGMTVSDQVTIEKVYKLEEKQQREQYQALIALADDETIQAIIESVNLINEYDRNINNEKLVLSLTDHIVFAVKRIEQGQMIKNPFLLETQHLYKEAYDVAQKVIQRLNARLKVKLPDDEIGFIALHIASNSEEMSITEMHFVHHVIDKCIQIVELGLDIKIDTTSIQYQRFIRHIQFLIYRLRKNEIIQSNSEFEKMLKAHYPLCYNVAVKIMKMIQKEMNVEVYEAEVIYLTMHIHHFTDHQNV